jgi:hypothetical protein
MKFGQINFLVKKNRTIFVFEKRTPKFTRKISIKMKMLDALRPAIINITAEIEGVSPTSVRRVMNNTQNNDYVFYTYLSLEEEMEKAVDQAKLVSSVRRLLPFEETTKGVKDHEAFPPKELISGSVSPIPLAKKNKKNSKKSTSK